MHATFFVKLTLHEKSRYARQKVLTDIFDGCLFNFERGICPLEHPLLLYYLMNEQNGFGARCAPV